MGTGQMLLTVMAVVLLGVTILTVNRSSLSQGTILRQTELGIYAVSLASSYLQRAAALDFDEKTVSGTVFITVPMPQPPNIPAVDLTAANLLGTDASETPNKDETFDDFDDYKGFLRDTAITGVDKFRVTSDVYYVDESPPYKRNNSNMTWLKQMDIKVNCSIDRKVFTGESSATDTIRMSYIMGFYR